MTDTPGRARPPRSFSRTARCELRLDCNQRLKVTLATILCSLALSGCGDLAHTNPLDVDAPVAVEVTGPDSAFSYFDTLSFVAHTLPSYAPEVTTWSSTGRLQLIPLGHGRFYVSPSQSVQAAPETVWVEVDGRAASHVLNFVHKATEFRANVCGSPARMLTLDAFGLQRGLCASAFDARGYSAPSATPTVTVSDTSVIAVAVLGAGAQVTARANGTAVVTFAAAGMADSVIVTVRQRINYVVMSPTACASPGIYLSVGDSIQLSPTNRGVDAGGSLVADTARVRAAVSSMSFVDGDSRTNSVTVSPTGLVVATHTGSDIVQGFATTAEDGTVWSICYFWVR